MSSVNPGNSNLLFVRLGADLGFRRLSANEVLDFFRLVTVHDAGESIHYCKGSDFEAETMSFWLARFGLSPPESKDFALSLIPSSQSAAVCLLSKLLVDKDLTVGEMCHWVSDTIAVPDAREKMPSEVLKMMGTRYGCDLSQRNNVDFDLLRSAPDEVVLCLLWMCPSQIFSSLQENQAAKILRTLLAGGALVSLAVLLWGMFSSRAGVLIVSLLLLLVIALAFKVVIDRLPRFRMLK